MKSLAAVFKTPPKPIYANASTDVLAETDLLPATVSENKVKNLTLNSSLFTDLYLYLNLYLFTVH